MRSTRLMGVVVIAATCSFSSSIALADATSWSTNAAACVPINASGLIVTGGAVTEGAGTTATLYCGITRSALAGAFDSIEITYKGGESVIIGGANAAPAVVLPQLKGLVASELIEISKATGEETVKCGIQPPGSSAITTKSMLCNNSNVDFNNNFYYLRIVLQSGILAGQLETVYGSSLISTR